MKQSRRVRLIKTSSAVAAQKKLTQGKLTQGKLRIIGGRWRSRQLPVIDSEGLRPTTDRVRETLFNWLQMDIAGSRCLDLFAGSGALGLEAASRGAKEVVMVEKSSAVFKILQQNVKTLAASEVSLVQDDALDFLERLNADTHFDIVFIDPPYQSGLLEPVINRISLVAGSRVYLEARKGDDISVPENWRLLKDKTAGQIHYCLYEIEA